MGYLSLYNKIDRVELGGGYFVDIRKFLSHADTARAEAVRISKEIRSETASRDNGDVTATVMSIDQQAYNIEIMVAAIVDWNLDDEHDLPLPLPPYIPAKPTGEDKANAVRRDSIGKLPDYAVERILKQIQANKEAGLDPEALAAFPGESQSAPATT